MNWVVKLPFSDASPEGVSGTVIYPLEFLSKEKGAYPSCAPALVGRPFL